MAKMDGQDGTAINDKVNTVIHDADEYSPVFGAGGKEIGVDRVTIGPQRVERISRLGHLKRVPPLKNYIFYFKKTRKS
jgi:hypothetical protein